MTHIIYHVGSTIIIGNREGYATEAAAKAARTRMVLDPIAYAITEKETFLNTIEKKKKVKNLMSGKDVEIAVNTPLCLDPSSETYWSM